MSTESTPVSPLFKSAWLVSIGTGISRVSGLLREQVMAYFFGAGAATDAFVTAFRIPNLLRDLFAEGALSSSFVPVFKNKLVKETPEEAFRLADNVLTVLMVVLAVVTLLGIAASGFIVYLTAHGFVEDKAKFDLTVHLTQIMWPFLILVSISALIMGMLNSFDRFGYPAFAPAMFNIGNVLTVLILYLFFGASIYTLAVGVLVGGVGQILIMVPSLAKIGYRYRPRFSLIDEGLVKMMRLFTPMMIGLSASRINILLSTLLVSFLAEGSMSYLNYSFRLMHLPLGLFAVALGTVALPKVSEIASRGDMDGLGKTYVEALNLNFFLIIPSACALALLGRDMIDLIYQYGRFTEKDAANTTLALLHYSYGIIGMGAVRVTAPVYFALGDAKLPMRVSITSVIANIMLYYPLINLMDFAGVAAATSVAGLINFGMLLYFLPYKGVHVPFREIGKKASIILAVSLVSMGIARLIPMDQIDTSSRIINRLSHSLVPLLAGAGLYLGICFLLGLSEAKMFMNAIFRRRQKTDRG